MIRCSEDHVISDKHLQNLIIVTDELERLEAAKAAMAFHPRKGTPIHESNDYYDFYDKNRLLTPEDRLARMGATVREERARVKREV